MFFFFFASILASYFQLLRTFKSALYSNKTYSSSIHKLEINNEKPNPKFISDYVTAMHTVYYYTRSDLYFVPSPLHHTNTLTCNPVTYYMYIEVLGMYYYNTIGNRI